MFKPESIHTKRTDLKVAHICILGDDYNNVNPCQQQKAKPSVSSHLCQVASSPASICSKIFFSLPGNVEEPETSTQDILHSQPLPVSFGFGCLWLCFEHEKILNKDIVYCSTKAIIDEIACLKPPNNCKKLTQSPLLDDHPS